MQLSEELSRLLANMGRTLARNSREGALSPIDHSVLRRLAVEMDGARLSDLASLRGVDLSTMSRKVSRLIEQGYVQRSTDLDDKRASVLTLTDHGRKLVIAENARMGATLASTLTDWTQEEQDSLSQLLSKLNQTLEANL